MKLGFTGSNQITNDELNSLFMAFDENNDGRISYCELCK